jgi:hypothetical protein
MPPWYSGAGEVIENGIPCAGLTSHTASSVSLAHGASAYAVTVSTTAVAPGESVRSTMNLVDRSRAPCGRDHFVPQLKVADTARCSPTATLAPDTVIRPVVVSVSVSGAAAAVIVRRCVTSDGMFPGTPSAAPSTANDGFASADAGSEHNERAASARERRTMALLDHLSPLGAHPTSSGSRSSAVHSRSEPS